MSWDCSHLAKKRSPVSCLPRLSGWRQESSRLVVLRLVLVQPDGSDRIGAGCRAARHRLVTFTFSSAERSVGEEPGLLRTVKDEFLWVS